MADTKVHEKITVNLIRKASDALVSAADREGLTRTDTINRALQLYDFFSKVAAEGDGSVLVRSPFGEEHRLKLL